MFVGTLGDLITFSLLSVKLNFARLSSIFSTFSSKLFSLYFFTNKLFALTASKIMVRILLLQKNTV